VPGLAEKRPSVLVGALESIPYLLMPHARFLSGDRILLQPHSIKSGRWFEGYVHVVRKEEVGLRFHFSFQGWSETQRYNVRFKLNRFPLRRQHQALDSAFTARRVLFPAPGDLLTNPNLTRPHIRITVFNDLIATNPRQLLAVNSILRQAPGSVPFVIFGP
jgi:helicase MOV-10